MRTIVLDSGAFLAVERRDRAFAEFLQAADDESADIIIPATVIAEVWRDPPRHQSKRLIRVANGIVALGERSALEVGVLLGKSRTTQIADAHVVSVAIAQKPSIIATSDSSDIIALLQSAGVSYSTRGTNRSDVIVHAI